MILEQAGGQNRMPWLPDPHIPNFFGTFSDRLYRLSIEHRPTSDQSTAEMIAINGQIAAAGA
jgi:hypothetical protein